MRKRMLAIVLLLAAAVLAGCMEKIDKLKIEAPAYMYGDQAKSVDVMIEGPFSHADNLFTGSMRIGGKKLETIVFTPGTGLIHYDERNLANGEGPKRTDLGLIYYDKETMAYAIEVTDAALYASLTGKKQEDQSKLIISSPANNEEEANAVHDRLTKLDYFED
ncbi:hypothetical protein [Paenibacillus methanolicus]|uniref:Uncharacterized protein n=1 Tax=Paenibacillus methanolicus TaxID=582686 RepID=A0A5S5BUB1_9BACL|nr:hypothetical protein [Paenibacillus methanolicus]TYP70761.1 hypothetical protein BCM02_111269 [Paenibacillus methanolicus]